jgi:hypothetical protein
MTEAVTADDRWAIHDLLARFLTAFDEKDYETLRSSLADEIWCDHTSFRNAPAEHMPVDRYVRLRQAALDHLSLQHTCLDLFVWPDGPKILGRCNYIVHRFAAAHAPTAPKFFHSFGVYRFGFARADANWRINGISQQFLASLGDPELHGATRTTGNTARLA